MANYYYSGQGSLYVAQRNADGTPQNFVELGNVPSLELSIEVTKFEHKESQSGSRAVDLTIVQEKNGTFTMNLESITPENLALAFWGQSAANATAAFSDAHVVAKGIAATGATADADSRMLVSGTAGELYPGMAGVTVEDTAGGGGVSYDFAGARGTTATPAGALNGYWDANGNIHIFSTAEQTARSAPTVIANDDDLYVNGTGFSDNTQVDGFTVSSQERWVRFEGLNTIDDKVVLIDIFKASLDPLTGYGVINEELASMEINGSMLYDELQPGTSKFFRQVNVT